MIRATVTKSGRIRICADADSALVAARLPGATRTPQMPVRQWNMPFTLDSISILRGASASFEPELEAAARRLERVHDFVEGQRTADEVSPIAPIPLKPGAQLFLHQKRAYNICLALLGYDIPQQGSL